MGVTASCRNGSGHDSDHGERTEKGTMNSEPTDIIEAFVCHKDELPEEGMKSFDIEGGKVLLVNQKGVLSAIGTKCSHYGAPLEKGALCNGRIRCPWHGACFNIDTGDIEDFPGLDSIPKYEVSVEGGNVKVRASQSLLAADKRMKPMAKRDPENDVVFIVVGGGAAGATCVERLRQEGFTGQIIMVCREKHLPYDRPKLSKAMDLTFDKITLRSQQFYQSGDIELRMGTRAELVDAVEAKVHLSNKEVIPYDKLFLATGGRPRRLPVPGVNLAGVYVVRTPEDANAIATAATGKHTIIVGTSFIGMEAAAYLVSNNRAESVTIIGHTSVPFENSLGEVVGKRIQEMFEEQGAKFINSASVTKFVGEEGKLTGVKIDNGETIEANVAVMGVGVVPDTEFLYNSKIYRDDRGYVPVNEYLETNYPDVYCGGDIASFPLFLHDGDSVAIGHWQVAHNHGATAARNMLGQKVVVRSVPFFWTVLFGKSLRYTGHGKYDDVVISGDLDGLAFIAYYCQGDRVVALASLGKDPAAAKYAEMLQQGNFLTKDQIADDGDIALKL